jgi:hypothetical protein
MTEPGPPQSPLDRAPEEGKPRPRWWLRILVGVAVVIVLLVVGGVLLARQAGQAKDELTTARSLVSQVRDQLRRGETADVQQLVGEIRRHADRAKNDTDGFLWSIASHLPVLGDDVTTARGMTRAIATIANDQLPPLAQVITQISPAKLRLPDGTIDVPGLVQAQQAVAKALPSVANATTTVMHLPGTHLGALTSARRSLGTELTKLSGDLGGAHRALDVLVPMLAPGGRRTYFVAFQNPAESHGTGGLIGSWGLITVENGKANLTRVGTDAELDQSVGGTDPVAVNLPGDYLDRWANAFPTEDWRSGNLDPNFPYAGQIWSAKFAKQFHIQVDGVIAVDPYFLQSLVGPDGSIPLPDGTRLAGPQIPTYTMSTLYTKYANRDDVRKAQLTAIVRATFDEVQHARIEGALLQRLQDAAETGHLQIWSAHPDEQKAVLPTEVSGWMPDRTGPFVWFSTVNTAGNKADFWTDRSVSYSAGSCPPASAGAGAARVSTVTVTLTNRVPLGQPKVVAGRFDTAAAGKPYGQVPTTLSIYLAKGAQVADASLNGREAQVQAGFSSGRPVYTFNLELPRDAPQTVVLHVSEPASGPLLQWRAQPLVRPLGARVNVPMCS